MAVNRQVKYKPPGLIDNYIYFYHLEKFCVIPLYPESITDRMRSTFQETNSLSRSAPVFTYSSSGPRSVSISLELHRDLMNDINTNVSNFKEIGDSNSDAPVLEFRNKFKEYKNKSVDGIEYTNYKLEEENDYVDILIKYLMAASVPRYQIYSSGAKGVIPPMVAVRFGHDIFIKGVINSDIQVTYKKPIMVTSTGQSKYANISVTFTIYETEPYDADSIKELGSFRGICGTNNIYSSSVERDVASTYNVSSPLLGASGGNNSTQDSYLVRQPSLEEAGEFVFYQEDNNNILNQKKDPYTDSMSSSIKDNGVGGR